MNILLTWYTWAGKSTCVEYLKTKFADVNCISVSWFVISEAKRQFPNNPEKWNKEFFPAVWDSMRINMSETILAELAYDEFQKQSSKIYIFDGVRYDKDISFLKDKIFKLFVVWISVAWEDILVDRIISRWKSTDIHQNSEKIKTSLSTESNSRFMNVQKCLEMSDYIIDNSWPLDDFYRNIDDCISEFYR